MTATARLTVRTGPGTNYNASGSKAKGSHLCVVKEVRGGPAPVAVAGASADVVMESGAGARTAAQGTSRGSAVSRSAGLAVAETVGDLAIGAPVFAHRDVLDDRSSLEHAALRDVSTWATRRREVRRPR